MRDEDEAALVVAHVKGFVGPNATHSRRNPSCCPQILPKNQFERSFAQEFLCPWQDRDVFTDEAGTDDDGIADAATYFGVSELAVLTTLVNKGKLPRSRLQAS